MSEIRTNPETKSSTDFKSKLKVWWRDSKDGLTFLALVLILLVIYAAFTRIVFKAQQPQYDVLNRKLFHFPLLENCCSLWPISHFIVFLIAGFLSPRAWWLFIIMGAMWELFEVIMGKLTYGESFQRQALRSGVGSSEIEYSSNWWAGSWKDIAFNTVGIGMGVLLRREWDKRKEMNKGNGQK